jgi:hypothetical protein
MWRSERKFNLVWPQIFTDEQIVVSSLRLDPFGQRPNATELLQRSQIKNHLCKSVAAAAVYSGLNKTCSRDLPARLKSSARFWSAAALRRFSPGRTGGAKAAEGRRTPGRWRASRSPQSSLSATVLFNLP